MFRPLHRTCKIAQGDSPALQVVGDDVRLVERVGGTQLYMPFALRPDAHHLRREAESVAVDIQAIGCVSANVRRGPYRLGNDRRAEKSTRKPFTPSLSGITCMVTPEGGLPLVPIVLYAFTPSGVVDRPGTKRNCKTRERQWLLGGSAPCRLSEASRICKS